MSGGGSKTAAATNLPYVQCTVATPPVRLPTGSEPSSFVGFEEATHDLFDPPLTLLGGKERRGTCVVNRIQSFLFPLPRALC